MRLLSLTDDGVLSISYHPPDNIPPYIILSHTWGDDEQEVTFEDVIQGIAEKKVGFRKIQFCGKRAAEDGFKYFWVDTCCIQKSSSSELSEAITSMFKWYKRASRCYVYLSDVAIAKSTEDTDHSLWKLSFRRSRWFMRGWTLQELIAPSLVEFFSAEGWWLGSKSSLEQLLFEITGIPLSVLRGRDLSEFSIEERKSWAQGRETKREEDRAYCLLGIFKVSLLPNYGEGVDNAFRRLDEEISKHVIDGSHFPDEEAYKSHRAQDGLGSTRSEIEKNLLDLLYFDEIDARLLTLQTAHSNTCRWFLRTRQYQVWNTSQHNNNSFLWIKGKPGAGKSILMKFLLSQANETAKSCAEPLILPFFFNARGVQLEKSTLGLYRSLLWQLFTKIKNLREVLRQLGYNAERMIQRHGWHPQILKDTFSKAIERLKDRTIQVFIDALDECPYEDVAEMISFFEDLRERATEADVQLRICFSSRYYPALTIQTGIQVMLENEGEHRADIAQYIKRTLKYRSSDGLEKIKSQVLRKSGGIFLWVALVIPMLNAASAKGRVSDIQRCLDGLPERLEDLFETIILRDDENIEDLRWCVQLVLFASRPLELHEYYFAWQTHSAISADVSDMHRFVQSSSKGLIEVTKTRDKGAETIQFIHESVRTFFERGGYQKLWPAYGDRFVSFSHEMLKRRCFAEIQASVTSKAIVIRQSERKIIWSEGVPGSLDLSTSDSKDAVFSRICKSLRRELPFLTYSVRYVLYHSDAAESSEYTQNTFITEFPLKYWISLHNLLLNGSEEYPIDASLLFVIVDHDLLRLAKLELGIKVEERHYPPLFAAWSHIDSNAISALDSGNYRPDSHLDILAQLFFSPLGHNYIHKAPIIRAAQRGNAEIVEVLLEDNEINADITDGFDRTPLAWAAELGHTEVVRRLLSINSVDPDSKDKLGWTPLLQATVNGHKNIARILLENKSVDPDSKDSYGRTPLLFAVRHKSQGLVQTLLNTGRVNPNSSDLAGTTPLLLAAELGHADLVDTLLQAGANPNARNADHMTPLTLVLRGWMIRSQETAKIGYIVRSLLERKADPNMKDQHGTSPLQFTMRSESLSTIQRAHIIYMLMDAGADPAH